MSKKHNQRIKAALDRAVAMSKAYRNPSVTYALHNLCATLTGGIESVPQALRDDVAKWENAARCESCALASCEDCKYYVITKGKTNKEANQNG